MQNITEDKLVDARDLMCPMPVMAATKAMRRLTPGQVLKVMATDRGSVADFQGWAKIAKNMALVGQETESVDGATVYNHYVRRTA